MGYNFLVGPGKKPSVCKLIHGRAMQRRVGGGGVSPFHDVHQKEGVSINVDVFGNPLSVFLCERLDFDPRIHPF